MKRVIQNFMRDFSISVSHNCQEHLETFTFFQMRPTLRKESLFLSSSVVSFGPRTEEELTLLKHLCNR